MFGYIAPDMSRLTQDQRNEYRRVYCGLCHALSVRSGSSGRLSLSHDMTFLALLLSSLYEPEENDHSARCALHPLRSHPYMSSSMIDYAADMNLLLFYLRCRDQKLDHDSISGTAGERLFRKRADRIVQLYPRQSDGIQCALDQLWQLEKSSDPDPDTLCRLSGAMLAAAFVPDPDDIWAPQLAATGAGLGRFVYWMDAWEDYDEDIRKGRFNPLRRWHEREDYENFCRETLELLIAEATEPFELLPLESHLDIMRNILYSGVWQRYAMVYRKKFGKEAEGK